MSDFLFSAGSTVCEVLTSMSVASGGCYNPAEMNLLGAVSTGHAVFALGMWALMRS